MKKITLMMFLLTIAFLSLAVVPAKADAVVYSNGPINGNVNADGIMKPCPTCPTYAVTDSFVLSSTTTLTDADNIGVWISRLNISSAQPKTVDWLITSDIFGGTTFASGTANLTDTLVTASNAFHDPVWSVDFTLPGVTLAAGTYWFQLQNATSTDPAGTNAIYWDENSGVGAGPGGPSQAWFTSNGGSTISGELSNSFELTGTAGGGTTPEPGSLTLLGSGLIGVAQILRRKLHKA